MKQKPLVGDIVRLNDEGMSQIGGLTSAKQIEQSRRMTITAVDHDSMTAPEETWMIDVDQPLMNLFLISHHDVDLIERPSFLSGKR